MSVVRRHIGEGAVTPGKLNAVLSDGSYAYEKFNYQPHNTKADGYSAPTGATGDLNLAQFRRLTALYHIKGAGQTQLGPQILGTNGRLQVGLDQAAAEGVQYDFGQTNSVAANSLGLTINAGKARFARLKFLLTTVANAAEAAFGFRRNQVVTANLDDYNDFAVLNAQAGVINIETSLNGAATVTNNTGKTWADGAVHEFKVIVSHDGKVRFYVDEQEVAASPAFTFDTGDHVFPFFFFLNGGASAGAVEWVEFECGNVEDVDDYLIL